MAHYPYTIDNGHGERLTFTGVTKGPDGDRADVEGVAAPGAGPPMHVHYLQDEAARVVRGRLGYQVLGREAQSAGPGELVVWPAGTPHKWWNAGSDELHITGWCSPPDNIEFFLSAMFASVKENGGRPGLFDMAFLATRYRSEFAMLELPAVVRRVVIPLLYVVGGVLGKRGKYKDAPAPIAPDRRRPGRALLLSCVALAWLVGCSASPGNPKVPAGATSSRGLHGTIETDKGPIEIEFFAADAPKAVENFRLLAEHGYYDGITFHRVVKGFMIQGGDPAGDGSGGQSAWGPAFADEINAESALYRGGYRRGLIAMANSGPNTNASQFFIMHQDYPLPPNYVIFARVTGSMDAVDAIANSPTTLGADGGMSKPTTPPVIEKVTIRP
jgi:cyclophilin family peptidyl-prolyl cis-trans isomerase/quercetin dioxygenase-like cupin family protein